MKEGERMGLERNRPCSLIHSSNIKVRTKYKKTNLFYSQKVKWDKSRFTYMLKFLKFLWECLKLRPNYNCVLLKFHSENKNLGYKDLSEVQSKAQKCRRSGFSVDFA